MTATPTVFVVDDDAAVRAGLLAMFEAAGVAAEAYASAAEFLKAYRPGGVGCLVLDVNMPDMKGPELQVELNRRGSNLPIIFLTAHGDIPTTVKAIKAGAVDFLTKPADGAVLLDRVRAALARSAQLSGALSNLTEREREVMLYMAAGRSSKETARELEISYRTVELYRSRILQKVKAHSVLELADIVRALGLTLPPSNQKPR
jgi:FixJ family two-component response regulator